MSPLSPPAGCMAMGVAATCCEDFFGKAMENPGTTYGEWWKINENQWKTHRRYWTTMENPWKVLEKTHVSVVIFRKILMFSV
jgi:hypothetical protein